MEAVISHKTALEYWRMAGLYGILEPRSSNRIKIPVSFDTRQVGYLANEGLLSLPLHGLTNVKHKSTGIAVSHYRPTPLPKGSLCKITDNLFITSPELTLVEMVCDLPFAQGVALICEFCGLYSINPARNGELFSRQPLTTINQFKAFLDKAQGLRGLHTARIAANFAFDHSRSPRETAASLLLSLKPKRGGYALEKPNVNSHITLDKKTQNITGVTQLEPDLLWPEQKVCLEYDSASFHGDDLQLTIDAQRKNALQSAGYQVVTLTSAQISNVSQMDVVAKQLAKLTGKRFAMPDYQAQKVLREQLLG